LGVIKKFINSLYIYFKYHNKIVKIVLNSPNINKRNEKAERIQCFKFKTIFLNTLRALFLGTNN